MILCVDDEETALVLRRAVLQRAGYQVITAQSGSEALQYVASGDFALVLSDYLMPGMNGAELTKHIKTTHPDIPVLLISGLNEPPSDAAVAEGFISKPVGPETLCEEVAALLSRQN